MSVRRAQVGDEEIVRAIRLAALADAPDAFSSTLAREEARTPGEWRGWIEQGAVFLYETAAGPRGIVAGMPHRDDPARAYLIAMWVHPGARGSGVADALVRAVLAWAGGEGFARVVLDVRAGNEPARRLYERHGFRTTGHATPGRHGGIELEMERDAGPNPEAPEATGGRS